jgi:hypothetical protein
MVLALRLSIWRAGLAGHRLDVVEHALDRARRRAESAGVVVRWIYGDVTELQSLGLGEDWLLLGHRLGAERLRSGPAWADAAYAAHLVSAAQTLSYSCDWSRGWVGCTVAAI